MYNIPDFLKGKKIIRYIVKVSWIERSRMNQLVDDLLKESQRCLYNSPGYIGSVPLPGMPLRAKFT